MHDTTREPRQIVIRGTMRLSGHQSRHFDHLTAEVAIEDPYPHVSCIRIHRPDEEEVDACAARMNALVEKGMVSIRATIVDGILRTTPSGISRIVEPCDGTGDFDETARDRIGRLDDLFDALRDISRNADDLPTRPGSCAMIIAAFAPFIERMGPVRCETSPIGGVMASFGIGKRTVSVHAMPQGHMTITGQGNWITSARHDVASAQNALRTMLNPG